MITYSIHDVLIVVNNEHLSKILSQEAITIGLVNKWKKTLKIQVKF